jgi:hypothetical protein
MRNLLVVGLLIVTLIVGILVVQNMRTESADGSRKTEAVDRARDARDAAEDAAQKVRQGIEDLSD